jgi:ABC-2 type transport system permease protein
VNATYLKYEVLRTLRNRQGFIFSLIFPFVMFLLLGASNRTIGNFGGSGIPAVNYYMVGMLSFGAIGAVVAGGARISVDRGLGWNRQLRLSPLSARAYLASKLVIGYLTALMTLALLYVSGVALGVRISGPHWVAMTALILTGLVPFAAMGIWIGHVAKPDAIGPIMGGVMSLFALLGGSWFPVGSGVLGTVGSWLPSFWIVQAGHLAVGGQPWPVKGWVVIAVWTAVFTVLAQRAFRADTGRG